MRNLTLHLHYIKISLKTTPKIAVCLMHAEPCLALAVPVEHISGLDNLLLPVAAGGSGNGGMYEGTDLRNAWYDGTTTDTALMLELGPRGQSFFQASGEGGAYAPTMFAAYVSRKLDCRQFPWITIVGGTDLHTSDSGGSYGSI